MKTKQAKTTEIKVVKVKPKETKNKLSQHQRMNSSSSRSKHDQDATSDINLMLSKQVDAQCNIKIKKKKTSADNAKPLSKKRLKFSRAVILKQFIAQPENSPYNSDASFGESNFTDSSLNSAEAKVFTDQNSKQYQSVPEQRRSLGSPVIIEAYPKISSYKIPKILRQNHELHKDDGDCNTLPLQVRCSNSKRSKASIIVAQCYSPDSQGINSQSPAAPRTATAKPTKHNFKPRKSKTPLISKNESVAGTSATFEESLGNFTIDETNGNSNLLEPQNENSTSEGTSNDVQGYHSRVEFYCVTNKVVAVMSRKTRFCFTGKIVLKVVFGAVEVYGSLITTTTKPTEIYSPKGYSSVCVRTSAKVSRDVQPDIWTSLSAEGIDRNTETKLVANLNNLNAGSTVLLLSNLENELTKFLNAIFPFPLFPSIEDVPYQSCADKKRAEAILQSKIYVGGHRGKELVVDQQITQQVAETMLKSWRANKQCCTLIAGGKHVGKSTSVRCLINSLLSTSKMVVLVDFDLGQAECTPPGCISYSLIEEPLLGPNFTHLKPPAFQLYIGDVDVTSCITRYIEGMKMLVDRLRSCPVASRLPTVVNTMGYTRGVGWDIMIFTIRLIEPSLVVQITSQNGKLNFPDLLSNKVVDKQKHKKVSWAENFKWNDSCNHELRVMRSHADHKTAPVNKTLKMKPIQQRELALISYLSEILRTPIDLASDSNGLSLHEAVPYVTPFSSIIVSIPRASSPPTHVLNVINGNVVALCGTDLENHNSQSRCSVSGLRVLDRLPLCQCYGFGIVRGVDTEREEVFINTPLPAPVMRYVNCLVGCVPMPAMLLQLNQQKTVPYTGGSNQLPTGREHRRGTFRVTHQQANS